jgi:nicotinamide riboside transporter PnuC
MSMPTFVELLGYAAFVSNVAGNLMLAQQTIWGWVVRIVAILLWGAYGWSTADSPMIANACTFFCINCYGWWKWRRTAQQVQEANVMVAKGHPAGSCKACGLPVTRVDTCANHDA